MKQRILLFSLSLGFAYLTLSSNKTGPAHAGTGDKTGRLGATCVGTCHKDWATGPTSTTTCTIELRRKDWGASSTPVTGYIAGKTYIVTISGTNSISLPKYGFQLTNTDGSGATVGTFSNFPSNVGQWPVTPVMLVEHILAIPSSGGNYSSTFEWTAPSSASGAITFWGILNAVDGNGAYNNDQPSAPVSVVLQDVTSVGTIAAENKFTAYPNPFTNDLNIKTGNTTSATYTIKAFDLAGRKMMEQDLSTNNLALHTENWAPGHYIIQLSRDNHSQIIPVVKK